MWIQNDWSHIRSPLNLYLQINENTCIHNPDHDSSYESLKGTRKFASAKVFLAKCEVTIGWWMVSKCLKALM